MAEEKEENVVAVAPGTLGVILKDKKSGMEVCEIFPSCPFQDKVKVGDIIKSIKCCGQQFTTIAELCKSPKQVSEFRYCHITPGETENKTAQTESKADVDPDQTDTRTNKTESETTKPKSKKRKKETKYSVHEIQAPAGFLGLRLNFKRTILGIMPESPVGNKLHVGDRIISINSQDVREINAQQIKKMLEPSVSKRFIGIMKPIKRKSPSPKRQKIDDDTKKGSKKKHPAAPIATPPSPPDPVELPYKQEDLPTVLRNLQLPKIPYQPSTLIKPGERLAVKKAIIEAYTWHESTKKLETLLPLTEDCEPAHTSLSALIAEQKRKIDAILLFEEKKLTCFERHLRALVEYKIEHGNFDNLKHKPRESCPPSNALQRCIETYRQHKEEKEKSIGPKRKGHKKNWDDNRAAWEENFQILEDLGVTLDVPVKKALPYGTWDDSFERLKRFKEREGHCKVPQLYKEEDGCTLGSWVANQRKDYERYCCGQRKRNGMDVDRILKLESIGFVWKLRHGRPKRYDPKFRNKRIGVGYDKPEGEEERAKEEPENITTDSAAKAYTTREEQFNMDNNSYALSENISTSIQLKR